MKIYWKKGKLSAVLACAILLVTIAADNNVAAKSKVIKLRCAAGHPYAAAVWVQTLQDFFGPEVEKRVAERTNHKVVIQHLYGGSLAKLGEVLEAVESGVADMGLPCTVFEVSKMYLHNYTWWAPFTTTDIHLMLRAHRKVAVQYPVLDEIMKGYNQKIIGWMPLGSVQLVTQFSVRTLDDLKGKKIANGGPLIPWLEALGCVGVQSRLNEGYTSLQTGVYQGWATPISPIVGFKLYEPAPHLTVVNFGAIMAGAITVNRDVWSKLPEEIREIIQEVGREYEVKLADNSKAQLLKNMDKLRKAGVEIYELPLQEKSHWGKALDNAGVAIKSAQKADVKGWPGTDLLSDYIQSLEKEGYRFPYRPKL
jgi:TRAP-type C4-dicarboxylate transport system substrate-binding protein